MNKFRVGVAALAFSLAGAVALMQDEGFTSRAVQPLPGDAWTIGHGTTTRADGSPVQPGDTVTPTEAVAHMVRDVARFEGALHDCVRAPLTQGEYDVYTRHAYNIGAGAFCSSTLVRRLNAGDYAGACGEILRWRFYRGRDCSLPGSGCAGLWLRRQRDHAACLQAQP